MGRVNYTIVFKPNSNNMKFSFWERKYYSLGLIFTVLYRTSGKPTENGSQFAPELVIETPGNYENTKSPSSNISSDEKSDGKRSVGLARNWLRNTEEELHSSNTTYKNQFRHTVLPWGEQRREEDTVSLLPSLPKFPSIPHIPDPPFIKDLSKFFNG